MKDFLLTLKFLLRQNLSLKYIIEQIKNDKRQRNMFIVIAIVLFLSLPSFVPFIILYARMYDIFASIGQESFFIVIAIAFSTLIILIFGIFQITSYFYLSNDVRILTPLPIRTKHILISKFIVVYIWELIISAFTVLPFFIIYGVKSGLDPLGWLTMILSYFLLPIIPLVIVGVLVVIVMKFTNIFRNRDTYRMISMLLMIIFVLGIQMYLQSMALSIPAGEEAEYFRNLIENNQFLLENVAIYYPVITLVINSIIGDAGFRIISVIFYFAISIGFIYIFGIILESVYLKSYLSEQEQVGRNRKVKNIDNKNRSTYYSIMSVDMKTLFRVPMFALNCLSTVIIIPVILIVTLISTGAIDQIIDLYEPNKFLFWLICALALTVIGTMNMITSTTFSREGKTNWIMRTLPISTSDHIKGRVLSSILVQIVFGVITIGIILYILKVDYLYGILTLILSMIASLPLQLIGLYIDLKRPVLKWDNPQVAVKQNTNVLISMAVGMIYAMGMALIYFGLSQVIILDRLITYIIFYLIYIVINLIMTNIIYSLLNKQFEESLVLME